VSTAEARHFAPVSLAHAAFACRCPAVARNKGVQQSISRFAPARFEVSRAG